jgi:hypothetical protein
MCAEMTGENGAVTEDPDFREPKIMDNSDTDSQNTKISKLWRQLMSEGNPIHNASIDPLAGVLINNTGGLIS